MNFPRLPTPTSIRLAVPMLNPSFWLHKDGTPERARTAGEELACRQKFARQIPLQDYEMCVIARQITAQALIEGKPAPQFRGLPTP